MTYFCTSSHSISFTWRNAICCALYFFCTFFSPLKVSAQVGTLFNSTRNLSSSYVNHVYQDRRGFIWVSTANGLNRYDGYTFQTYTSEDGLPIDVITCVIQDKSDLIYVGASTGLYVKIKGKFRSVINQENGEELTAYIKSLCLDPDGRIIIGTSGRGIWELVATDTVRNIVPYNSKAQYVNQIQFDHKGMLWASVDRYGLLG